MRNAKRTVSKIEKLLVNFKQDRPERTALHKRVKDLPWVHVEPYQRKWDVQDALKTHFETISKYTWTLCPCGEGQDTHRLCEPYIWGPSQWW